VHIIEDPPTATKDLNEEQQQPLVEEGVGSSGLRIIKKRG